MRNNDTPSCEQIVAPPAESACISDLNDDDSRISAADEFGDISSLEKQHTELNDEDSRISGDRESEKSELLKFLVQ